MVTGPSSPHPTWVLLRGLGRESAHWANLPQKLQAAWPGCQVFTPDLPGTGSQRAHTFPLSVAAVARTVRATLLSRTPSLGPVWLVGLSLGSMVALSWAQQFPHELKGVALLSGSVGGVCPRKWRVSPAAVAAFAQVALASKAEDREALILSITSAQTEVPHSAWKSWCQIATQRPVSRRTMARQLVAAARFAPKLQPLGLPTLVLAGAQDKIVNPSCAGRIAKALAAPVRIHPHAGHDLSLDAADWVVAELRTWALSEIVTIPM